MKCPKCGKEIANDSKFCEYCGEKLESKIAQKSDQNFRSFLLVVTLLISVSNILFFKIYSYDSAARAHDFVDCGFWFLVPVLIFIIAVICVVLYVKKKISGIFTALICVIFCLNVAIILKSFFAKDEYKTVYVIGLSLNDSNVFVNTVGGFACYYPSKLYYESEAKVYCDRINCSIPIQKGKFEITACYKEKKDYFQSIGHVEIFMYSMLFVEFCLIALYLVYARVICKNKKITNQSNI